jgi:hypothetical protein
VYDEVKWQCREPLQLFHYIGNVTMISHEKIKEVYEVMVERHIFDGLGLTECSRLGETSAAMWLFAKGFVELDLREIFIQRHDQQERVRLLFEHDGKDFTPSFPVQTWEEWQRGVGHSEWASEAAFIVIPPSHHRRWVHEFMQSSGFQSAILTLYYVQMRNDSKAEMIDLTSFAMRRFEREDIQEWIIDGCGVRPENFLRTLLGQDHVAEDQLSSLNAQILSERGPVFITDFHAFSDFYEMRASYDGHVEGRDTFTYLAMVIIGVRMDASEMKWFLVQNAFPKMQYVEVSLEFLISAGVYNYFYLTGVMSLPIGTPVTSLPVVVSAVHAGLLDTQGCP